MTQEFHLSVTPIGNSQYLVRTEYPIPRGVPLAEEQVTWDVDRWLAQARRLMCDPLQSVLRGEVSPASSLSNPSLSLVELGQELYTSLFQDTLRDSWVIAQGVAQHRREALRLRLGLKGSELPRIPWEVMYGADVPVERLRKSGSITAAPRPLVTGTRIIFSRYQSATHLAEETLSVRTAPNQPLRILMVVSAPSDQEQLKLAREVRQMQHELESHSQTEVGTPEIQLTVLQQPGREELTRMLEQSHFQVLHYAGHSDLSREGGSLYLVNNRTGLTEILTGDDLAGLLVNNGIRLAVFNSCRGAYTAARSGNEQARNLAEASVSRGIPAVLAMAEQIPDNVALNLTTLFYRNLKLGFPIDLSLNRARQGLISAYGSNQFYWALPVLYQHPEFDGYLMGDDRTQENLADRYSAMPANHSLPALMRRESAGSHPGPTAGTSQQKRFAPQGSQAKELELEDTQSEVNEKQLIAEILQQLSPSVPLSTHLPTAAAVHRTESSPATSSPATSSQVEPGSPLSATAAASSSATVDSLGSPSFPQAKTAPDKSSKRLAAKGFGFGRFLLLPVLGAIGFGLAYGAQQVPLPQNWQMPHWLNQASNPEPATTEPSPSPVDLSQTSGEFRASAIYFFRQEQLTDGLAAVEVLLDRNELEDASAALRAVPEEFTNDPRINFMRGRLCWQGMKAKNGEHTVQQAQDFWTQAAKADKTNLDYQMALGFSYYVDDAQANAANQALVENKLQTAIQIWSDTKSSLLSTDPKTLPFEAGIALALKKSAANYPPESRQAYLVNAVQSYQIVMNRDPINYSSEALRQNWLWTEEAVKEWEALGQLAQGRQPSQDS